MMWQVVQADVLEWAANYDGPKFHALLCDPPWEYNFMSKDWDNTGITFQSKTWATLAEVLHPGAFLMVFAGSRGWHRLACAMEDAGLILQPSIFIWLNSQSFPKASRLRKAPKPERKRLYRWLGWLGRLGNWFLRKRGKTPKYYLDFVWEGHRYGGQILKDCASPIIVAQKPWTNPRLDCIVRTGAGSLNVDAGRIGTNDSLAGGPGISGWDKWRHVQGARPNFYYEHEEPGKRIDNTGKGRWPSNFALVHKAPGPDGEGGCVRAGTRRVNVPRGKHAVASGKGSKSMFDGGKDRPPLGYADPDGMETVAAWRCEPDCPAFRLGQQSGIREVSGTAKLDKISKAGNTFFGTGDSEYQRDPMPNDKGTAARYYHQSGWDHERAEMACCAEDCVCRKLDEQAGERKSGGWPARHGDALGTPTYSDFHGKPTNREKDLKSTGNASRFYAQAGWEHEIAERLATGDPVRYQPKAAKKERNQGLDQFYWRKDKQSPTGFVRITKDEWEALGEEEKRIKEETGKAGIAAGARQYPRGRETNRIMQMVVIIAFTSEGIRA